MGVRHTDSSEGGGERRFARRVWWCHVKKKSEYPIATGGWWQAFIWRESKGLCGGKKGVRGEGIVSEECVQNGVLVFPNR